MKCFVLELFLMAKMLFGSINIQIRKTYFVRDFGIIISDLNLISGMVGNGIRMCFVDRNATILHRKVI